MRVAGCFLRPDRESVEKTAQFTALIITKKSPGVPILPVERDNKLPFVTTSKTPKAARIIPAAWYQTNGSLRINNPSSAINMGVLVIIQAVVVACAVTSPV